jgi:hypothetical protein
LVLLWIAAEAAAQQATQPEQQQSRAVRPEESCSVEGKVTDRRSGAPLGKARVGLRPVDPPVNTTSPNLNLPANAPPLVEVATDEARRGRTG